MKAKAIGIVAGGGGPLGSASVLNDIISECQITYHCTRSYEYPGLTFYSFPYSEMLLAHSSPSSIPSRELSHSIQQLKLLGMEIIVIPCFTMCSFLTFRNYGVELIEMGPVVADYLKKKQIKNPLVLCSERTRKAAYCETYFECTYPSLSLQKDVTQLIEEALKGNKVDLTALLKMLPDVPILCASTVLNGQIEKTQDERLINPNKILASYVVNRSFEGTACSKYQTLSSQEEYSADCHLASRLKNA